MRNAMRLQTLARHYIEAADDKHYDAVAARLSPAVFFKGSASSSNNAAAFIAPLKRTAPIWEAHRVRYVFGGEDRVCVLYDRVTNTAAGAVPCVDLLTFDGDSLVSVELLFERMQYSPAAQALAQLTAR